MSEDYFYPFFTFLPFYLFTLLPFYPFTFLPFYLFTFSLDPHTRCGAECGEDSRCDRCDDLHYPFHGFFLSHTRFILLFQHGFFPQPSGLAQAPGSGAKVQSPATLLWGLTPVIPPATEDFTLGPDPSAPVRTQLRLVSRTVAAVIGWTVTRIVATSAAACTAALTVLCLPLCYCNFGPQRLSSFVESGRNRMWIAFTMSFGFSPSIAATFSTAASFFTSAVG